MAVNIGKTKFIIFHYEGKNTELNGRDLLYDDNEPNADDPHILSHSNATITIILTQTVEHISYLE